MSGRQNRKPKYLTDYDEADKDEEEDFNEEEVSEDDDESDDYNQGGGRKTNRRGVPKARGRPEHNKRQRLGTVQ